MSHIPSSPFSTAGLPGQLAQPDPLHGRQQPPFHGRQQAPLRVHQGEQGRLGQNTVSLPPAPSRVTTASRTFLRPTPPFSAPVVMHADDSTQINAHQPSQAVSFMHTQALPCLSTPASTPSYRHRPAHLSPLSTTALRRRIKPRRRLGRPLLASPPFAATATPDPSSPACPSIRAAPSRSSPPASVGDVNASFCCCPACPLLPPILGPPALFVPFALTVPGPNDPCHRNIAHHIRRNHRDKPTPRRPLRLRLRGSLRVAPTTPHLLLASCVFGPSRLPLQTPELCASVVPLKHSPATGPAVSASPTAATVLPRPQPPSSVPRAPAPPPSRTPTAVSPRADALLRAALRSTASTTDKGAEEHACTWTAT
ncbi:hypothetical protein B0H15DRAFT_947978 [Mycena belliarum]|uniref:Uncharacterized protein n=1 Tax=Mycena belliarum TaxID=1033014 RepID=A0AAD6U9L0_9AGAR|nr:hypothetical protein B0H15DRAFT_947978 [Mycena belliae]